MEKSELVLHNSENQFVSLGMPFHNNHMMLFMFVILKMIIDLNNSLHLQVALLNLITISSTWARVIDVMDSEVPFTISKEACVVLNTHCLLNLFFSFFPFPNPYFSFNSVRFKIIWFHWGWCYARATFRFVVCCKYGMAGTM